MLLTLPNRQQMQMPVIVVAIIVLLPICVIPLWLGWCWLLSAALPDGPALLVHPPYWLFFGLWLAIAAYLLAALDHLAPRA